MRLRDSAMWILGALIGAALGYIVAQGAWVLGAVVGAGIGWMLSRVSGSPAGDRLAELERLLEGACIADSMSWIGGSRRLKGGAHPIRAAPVAPVATPT
jgi:hypothetical protein